MKNVLYWLALSLCIVACAEDETPLPEPAETSKSSEKEIISFQFLLNENPISTHVIGEVDSVTHTIFAILPGNSLKTALLPEIILSTGATISPKGVQDFSKPVNYSIMAQDSTVQNYEVTVVTEKEALVAIYEANPSSRLEWNLRDPDISNWEGVTLSNGVIVDLLIHNVGLTTIPPEIGYLRHLTYLGIHMNDFTSVPASIGNLVHLERLSVGLNNNLNSIPPQIGQLERLKVLHIDNNRSLMALPAEIGNLTNLNGLYINGNGFTSIPSEICELETRYGITLYKDGDVICD